MTLIMLRRVSTISLLAFIVGGLWLLADWRANIGDGAPSSFAQPSVAFDQFATGDDTPDEPVIMDPVAPVRRMLPS